MARVKIAACQSSWYAVFQTPQLLLELRRRAEHSVGDIGELLRLLPLPLQLFDLRALVHGHFQRESPLGRETAQGELAARDVTDQPVRPPDVFYQARRIFGALTAAACQAQVGQALLQRRLGVATDEQCAFGAALRAAQDQAETGLGLGDDTGMREVAGRDVHDRAAALADRGLDEAEAAASHHPRVDRSGDVRHVPHEHADRSAGRHVHRDGEPDRCNRQRHHEPELLALACPKTLAVAPGRELYAWRLPDAYEVVAAPTDERHLLGRRGDTALPRRARQRFDLLEPVVEGREVPAGALGADHPQPAFPLVERQPPPNAEP